LITLTDLLTMHCCTQHCLKTLSGFCVNSFVNHEIEVMVGKFLQTFLLVFYVGLQYRLLKHGEKE